MIWDYRVLRKIKGAEECYGIHEVFYDDNGKMMACTEDPVAAFGESLGELKGDVISHLIACTQPAIDYDDIPEEGAKLLLVPDNLEGIETLSVEEWLDGLEDGSD